MGMRSPLSRLVPVLAASALLLSACSEDISSRGVMLETLDEQGSLTPEQAECVTADFFEGGAYTQDQLDDVASGFNNEDGTEKVPGFEAYATEVIASCIRQ